MTNPEEKTRTKSTRERLTRTGMLVHLAGSRRGAMDTLPSERILIGTDPDATVHFAAPREPAVAEHHAELVSGDPDTTIRPLEGNGVRVNGEPTDERVLAAGDVIQLGEDGPLLRYRVYAGEPSPYKTLAEALADCAANARFCADTPWSRVSTFASVMPGEVASLRPAMRWGMGITMLIILVAVVGLGYRSYTLEQRLERRTERLETVSAELAETRRETVRTDEITAMRERLSGTLKRLAEMESQLGAASAMIARASNSVVFLQGVYGFIDPDTGKRLRRAVDEDGEPVEAPSGQVRVRLGGSGTPLRHSYVGTAFVADEQGLLLTNHHVAQPWFFDKRAQRIIDRGLTARPERLIGYLPGHKESFKLKVVAVSESDDLAVLSAEAIAGEAKALELAGPVPEPGQEVILLGYPAGIKALVARADTASRKRLDSDGNIEFWNIPRRLAQADSIEPLATSGIIGQATARRIVYDAGTAGGGSGGPLLDRKGRVVAVNQAMLKEFGGSNLGIPVAEARPLLEEAQRKR